MLNHVLVGHLGHLGLDAIVLALLHRWDHYCLGGIVILMDALVGARHHSGR